MIRFTKENTSLVKGVAVILMVIHHLIGGNPGIPLNVIGTPVAQTLGTASKVCVALFMILSGYGMMESSRIKGTSNYRFVFNRLKKLYLTYWSAWVVLYIWTCAHGQKPLAEVFGYGVDPKAPYYIFRDLMGFFSFGSKTTPTFNGATWFMEAIVICYLLFPIFERVVSKANLPVHISLLLITYSPWIYFLYKNDSTIPSDRALFYIFPFVVGLLLSHYHILDKIKQWSANKRMPSIAISTVILVLCLYARQRICLPFDPFFALSIIFFLLCTLSHYESPMLIKDFFVTYGKMEADIWLLHPALLTVFGRVPFSTITYKTIFTVLLIGAVVQFYYRGKNYCFAKIGGWLNRIGDAKSKSITKE